MKLTFPKIEEQKQKKNYEFFIAKRIWFTVLPLAFAYAGMKFHWIFYFLILLPLIIDLEERA